MLEKEIKVYSGLKMLIVNLIMLVLSVVIGIAGIKGVIEGGAFLNVAEIILGCVLLVVWCVHLGGFFTLQPNTAAVLILFGEYKGTVKKDGWHFTNPFYTKKKLSLRSRNLNGEKLKVNDEMGNPIEIAAVIVWRVENTAQSFFDVENYAEYVKIQSESALRHLAGLYPYDITDEAKHLSLRGSADEVSEALRLELQERLAKAGVVVEEARLSHLAYAPEIAAAMLQRQQASAIIAARQMIVEGAVGMVEMALEKLSQKGVVDLDEERKAAMVSNLMVVLCGERSTQPVINTGTLHN
ncbi:SPFH domain/Band 7 family protein [Anaerobacterium chartisolvens]|uniref:SPFH domain/Band 7 family protein n=1 Tax=Anaerobacterium chartisolvens TaxID=1297424 RepID=A0A369B2H8_9FIRM|nr:SPFH domain-containing protein [Anaerobacterium chartisolvens]RCX15545.1 SPFH domain/Band 7 family protein [Anaerobacterium chartisolvens]